MALQFAAKDVQKFENTATSARPDSDILMEERLGCVGGDRFAQTRLPLLVE